MERRVWIQDVWWENKQEFRNKLKVIKKGKGRNQHFELGETGCMVYGTGTKIKKKKKVGGIWEQLRRYEESRTSSLKVQDVRYESASQRTCLDKYVYFESAA